MYIHKLNLLLVHLPKTGGESMTEVLMPQGLFGEKHVTWREFALSFPGLAQRRPIVATFVRNPWDQVLSFYSHLRKPAYLEKKKISTRADYFDADGFLHPHEVSRSACELEFPAWVQRWYPQRRCHASLTPLESLPSLWRMLRLRSPDKCAYRFYRDDAHKYLLPYLEWVTDVNGSVRADFVGRFENLHEDFSRLLSRFDLSARLPHLNRSQRGDYREAYDGRTRNLVAEYYAPEIARFDYRF